MTIQDLEMSMELDKQGLNPKKLKLIAAAVLSELAKIISTQDIFDYQDRSDGTRYIDPYRTKMNLSRKLLERSEEFLKQSLGP